MGETCLFCSLPSLAPHIELMFNTFFINKLVVGIPCNGLSLQALVPKHVHKR